MATSGVLKITTRLAKDKFKKDLKSLTKDIQQAETETNAMTEATEGMSTGLGASVGSMAKIAVIAGLIIGAFLLIKKAVENIVQNNEEVASKIEAIRNALSNIGQGIITALANLILPIVEKIINGVYTILSYINAITKAWWNYDLFAENASESLASGAGSAKEIQKALASFDTADVLGNEKGGVSGTDVKNAKKYNGELAKIPKWLQKIIDLKPVLDGIFTGTIKGIKDGWEWLKKYVPIIGLITGGWEGFKKSIDNSITGIGKFFTKMKEEHPIITRLVEAMFPMLLILDLISTNWDAIKSAIEKCVGWCKDLKNWFDKLADKTTDLLRDWGLIGEYVANSSSGMGHSGGGGRDGGSTSYSKGYTYQPSKVEKALSSLLGGAKKVFGLASGGIVNNPGKGVSLNQIVVGEGGPEAVLPLNDGTLQKLASMIPVQIELTNTIDGRVLSRRLETIRQNTAFSRNGG